MKFFERINHLFVSHPFLLYLFIFAFALIPFLVKAINKADQEMKAEADKKEKQKVCVVEKSQLQSTPYTVEICNDNTSRILTINGNPVEKDSNQ